MALSSALHRFWPVALLIPLGIVGFVAWARGGGEGQRVAAVLMLRVPGVATLRRYALAARFAEREKVQESLSAVDTMINVYGSLLRQLAGAL